MKSYKPLLKENDKEYILIRLVTDKELKSDYKHKKGFQSIPDKEGYEVVFKLFGDKGEREGRGFYYKKI